MAQTKSSCGTSSLVAPRPLLVSKRHQNADVIRPRSPVASIRSGAPSYTSVRSRSRPENGRGRSLEKGDTRSQAQSRISKPPSLGLARGGLHTENYTPEYIQQFWSKMHEEAVQFARSRGLPSSPNRGHNPSLQRQPSGKAQLRRHLSGHSSVPGTSMRVGASLKTPSTRAQGTPVRSSVGSAGIASSNGALAREGFGVVNGTSPGRLLLQPKTLKEARAQQLRIGSRPKTEPRPFTNLAAARQPQLRKERSKKARIVTPSVPRRVVSTSKAMSASTSLNQCDEATREASLGAELVSSSGSPVMADGS